MPSNALPPQLTAFYITLISTLRGFSHRPPYTVQRFAELILRPTAHYRTLPSYLRALDRVVSVSSTADTFPLPVVSTFGTDTNAFLASSSESSNPADDFNGAALTRIPWLRDAGPLVLGSERPLATDLRTESTSLIDGPNGAGSMETVTVNVVGMPAGGRSNASFSSKPGTGVGVADPAPSEQMRLSERAKDNGKISRQEEEADDELVHARGPEEIGVEDMGPQKTRGAGHIFDAEAAVGRPGEAENVPSQRAEDEHVDEVEVESGEEGEDDIQSSVKHIT